MMNMKKRLTAEEVAARLMCSVRQVGEYRKADILPGTRFGKTWMYFEEDVEALIVKNKGRDVCNYATKAFGMGVDVNDVNVVYHYAVTGTLNDYVQEIGRAARKTDMIGYAVTDNYYNDIAFMQRLFGMSQIKQYQINKVLAGIYDVYRNKKSRNFLISPESFTYIFNGKQKNEDSSINKLKTSLLMLEKDLYDKYKLN